MFTGRTNSAAHSSNHGQDCSIQVLCAGVCVDDPIPSSGQVKQTLEKIQKDYESNKHIAKFQACKKKLLLNVQNCKNSMETSRRI